MKNFLPPNHTQTIQTLYSIELIAQNTRLTQSNLILAKQLKKYKSLCRIRKYAIDIAVSKIVDNCKYCSLKNCSEKCKKTSCEKAMRRYFIDLAKIRHKV